MRKLWGFIIFIALIFMFPMKINASCNNETKARLRKIVSNVNISYEYQMIRNTAVFSLKFNNVFSDIYFKDQYGNNYYGDIDGETTLYNYPSGKSFTFTFYGTNDCKLEEVGKLYATTPAYNPYYQLSVCNDVPEFDLCQKWSSHSLNREQFIKEVNEYKNKQNIIDDSPIDKNISVIDFLFNFFKLYGIYVLIGIVIVIIVIKYINYKRDTFGF